MHLARSKVKHPRSNNVQKLADPCLKVQFRKSVLGKAIHVALMCVQDNAGTRPNMSDVVIALEYLISEQAGTGSDEREGRKHNPEERNTNKGRGERGRLRGGGL
ncbi:unnamed protein product [Ilex paraguariensis]|uniref:Uncharacterized protein n=1 Tax=Ilex paraguariensis TaxID=185542 RepID=A0ABC8U067_9AQUA